MGPDFKVVFYVAEFISCYYFFVIGPLLTVESLHASPPVSSQQ